MGRVEIDDRGWPYIDVRWQGAATDDQIAGFLAGMDRWLAMGTRFGVLVDSRGAQGMSSAQRKLVTAHMKKNETANRRLLGHAIVMDNAIQRALYAAINWVQPMAFASKSFSELEPARAWLKEQVGPGFSLPI